MPDEASAQVRLWCGNCAEGSESGRRAEIEAENERFSLNWLRSPNPLARAGLGTAGAVRVTPAAVTDHAAKAVEGEFRPRNQAVRQSCQESYC